MLIGIHKSRLPIHEDNELRIYLEILRHNEIPFVELDSSLPEFWDKLKEIDLFIYKWGHDHLSQQKALSIFPIIENILKIKCFPNYNTCWHYDDKIKQYYLLREAGFPVIDSFVFWDKKAALNWVEHWTEFPLVFKLCKGAGSLNVRQIHHKKKAKKIIHKMFGDGVFQDDESLAQVVKTLNYDFKKIFRYYAINVRNKYISKERNQFWLRHKNYVYFQRFLPNNLWDTRVTTAGMRAHAFRRFTRPGDFRASGSNQWDINPEKIDLEMVEIALKVSKYLGFQAMAYDFIYDKHKKPKIIEMSYLYGGAGYPDFMNGYWDDDLIWHKGRYWPQYFELIDLLGIGDLKLPEIETYTTYKKAKII